MGGVSRMNSLGLQTVGWHPPLLYLQTSWICSLQKALVNHSGDSVVSRLSGYGSSATSVGAKPNTWKRAPSPIQTLQGTPGPFQIPPSTPTGAEAPFAMAAPERTNPVVQG